jgi:hypothetical protein
VSVDHKVCKQKVNGHCVEGAKFSVLLASFRNFVRIPSVSLHCIPHKHPSPSNPKPNGLSYLPSHESSAWDMYLQQIDRVTPFLGDLSRWVETLRRPKRVLIVDVPIHMDDGRIAHFEGFRVQHNTSRGPGKGGVRFHQDVTLPEVMALSAWMSVKTQHSICHLVVPKGACVLTRDFCQKAS